METLNARFNRQAEDMLCAFLIFVSLLIYTVPFAFTGRMYELWMHEDGIIETSSALLWLLSAVFAFVLFAVTKPGNDFFAVRFRRNVFFLLLGLVFLSGFGEEISWGQRIFGFKTPESLSSINYQNEINLHNIDPLNVDRMFSLFWFCYCFLLPLAARFSPRVSAFLKRINLPVIPLMIGVLFPINYLISKPLESVFTGRVHNTPVELKEHNFALLFFAAMLSFVVSCFPRGKRPASD